MAKRKTFSKKFKLEAVRLLEESDKSPNEITADLGIRRKHALQVAKTTAKAG